MLYPHLLLVPEMHYLKKFLLKLTVPAQPESLAFLPLSDPPVPLAFPPLPVPPVPLVPLAFLPLPAPPVPLVFLQPVPIPELPVMQTLQPEPPAPEPALLQPQLYYQPHNSQQWSSLYSARSLLQPATLPSLS